MGLEVTGLNFKAIDPKTVDFDKLSDTEFHAQKFVQAFSLLPKIGMIIKLVEIEDANIQKQMAEAPKPKVVSEGMSVTVQLPRMIDSTTFSSLNFSLLLLQFTYIEALCNVVAESAIRQNRSSKILSEIEIDFLSEQIRTFKGGKINTKGSYVRLEDKASEYIALLAKVNQVDYKLDTSIHYWSDFKLAKTVRDEITHPKNGVHSNIDFDITFKLSKFIYWFTKEVANIYINHFDFKDYKWIENYSYGCVSLINKIRGGSADDVKEINAWHKQVV